MHSIFTPFKTSTRAYSLGMLAAQYWQQKCCLCHLNFSQPVKTVHTNNKKNLAFNNKWYKKYGDKGLLCRDCHPLFLPMPPAFSVQVIPQHMSAYQSLIIQSSFLYQYPLNQIIRQFKFKQDMTQLPVLIYLLRQLRRPHGCHADNSVILPMPTTKQRIQARGFDPVSILVAYLSIHWGIPIWDGVKRVDDTEHQKGLSRAERLQNLQHAFFVSKPIPVKRVILFDDVVTTGASMSTLAKTLLLASDTLKLTGYCVAHVDM